MCVIPPSSDIRIMAISVTARPRRIALRAAWLFDGTSSTLLPNPVVVLDGSTVTAVDSASAVPPDAEVVDMPGTTLLPGLIDTHVHLAFDGSAQPVAALAARSAAEVVVAMMEAGESTVRAGVTTVRDLGDRDYLSLGLRDRAGMPTVVAAGPPVTTPNGHCHYLGGTTTDIRAAVRERAERGCDVVKIMASGGTLTPGTLQEKSQFSADELRAAVDEAHRLGLPVTAHAHGSQAIADAVDAGVDGLEHVSFWSADGVDDRPDLIRAIAERRIVVGATIGAKPIPGVAPPPAIARRLPAVMAALRAMYEAGAPFVAGTDSGIGPPKPHSVLPYAIPHLRQIGLSAADSLRTVTSVAAGVCGLAHRKGRVAPGFDADVIAVAGDPLTDPTALLRVQAVYMRGNREF
jgi:imidazolonepropionase-like amidohydrolase